MHGSVDHTRWASEDVVVYFSQLVHGIARPIHAEIDRVIDSTLKAKTAPKAGTK
jgi:hypothetical protein